MSFCFPTTCQMLLLKKLDISASMILVLELVKMAKWLLVYIEDGDDCKIADMEGGGPSSWKASLKIL